MIISTLILIPLSVRVAGKEAMIKGPGMFNKAASLSYRSLNQTKRAQLKEACIKESSKEERMSAREVMREGKKVSQNFNVW